MSQDVIKKIGQYQYNQRYCLGEGYYFEIDLSVEYLKVFTLTQNKRWQ